MISALPNAGTLVIDPGTRHAVLFRVRATLGSASRARTPRDVLEEHNENEEEEHRSTQ